MGVYIKGMEMPKNCYECDDMFLLSTIRCECCEFGLNERPPECPLTEVSEPHGRLIDADAVMRKNLFTERDRGFLFDAPTVIEGEVEE